MYFVDRKEIDQSLEYMSGCLHTFTGQTDWTNPISKLALERLIHVVIESVIDVGNQLIDGFIMRDPGSYEDIIDILTDERVIDASQDKPLKDFIGCRKAVIKNYKDIDHQALLDAMSQANASLQDFPSKVRQYLEKELGPVSAFLPEDDTE